MEINNSATQFSKCFAKRLYRLQNFQVFQFYYPLYRQIHRQQHSARLGNIDPSWNIHSVIRVRFYFINAFIFEHRAQFTFVSALFKLILEQRTSLFKRACFISKLQTSRMCKIVDKRLFVQKILSKLVWHTCKRVQVCNRVRNKMFHVCWLET